MPRIHMQADVSIDVLVKAMGVYRNDDSYHQSRPWS
jgi:hypothetical protein